MEHQKSWWDYFSEDPYEKIGRQMTGAFGEPLVIELTRIAWAYLDWLEQHHYADIRQFVIDNERVRLPEDGCIHSWIEGAVKTAFLRRERNDAARPDWLPPAHPVEYTDI